MIGIGGAGRGNASGDDSSLAGPDDSILDVLKPVMVPVGMPVVPFALMVLG